MNIVQRLTAKSIILEIKQKQLNKEIKVDDQIKILNILYIWLWFHINNGKMEMGNYKLVGKGQRKIQCGGERRERERLGNHRRMNIRDKI